MGLRLALAISSPQPLAPPYAAQLLPLTTTAWQHHWEHLCTLDPNSHPDPQRAHLADQWRRGQPFSRTHVTLSKSEHSAQVILAASHWLELDSLAEGIRFDSDLAMRQEVAYAQHLGAATILLPPPLNPQFLTDYARAIKGALLSTTTIIVSHPCRVRPFLTPTDLDQDSNRRAGSVQHKSRFSTRHAGSGR